MSHKILQISDYLTLMGGIEMYVSTTSRFLVAHGVKTRSIWLTLPLFILGKIRYLLLPCSILNVPSSIYMIVIYHLFKPDILRFHSVSRFHGWLPVILSKILPVRRLMIYHDLWYFHPFPSYVTQEDQILPWWYKNWMTMTTETIKRRYTAQSLTWWRYTTIIVGSFCKYLTMSLLRYALLYSIDVHIIPSSFMLPYLLDWWVKKSSIKILPHCIVDKNSL